MTWAPVIREQKRAFLALSGSYLLLWVPQALIPLPTGSLSHGSDTGLNLCRWAPGPGQSVVIPYLLGVDKQTQGSLPHGVGVRGDPTGCMGNRKVKGQGRGPEWLWTVEEASALERTQWGHGLVGTLAQPWAPSPALPKISKMGIGRDSEPRTLRHLFEVMKASWWVTLSGQGH